jgi:uncharacterized protein (DUF433 family)
LTDRDINRLVDEQVMPDALVIRDEGRRFAPLAGPFAKFYFDSGNELTKSARVFVLITLTRRLLERPERDELLTLARPDAGVRFDWSVSYPALKVELKSYVSEAWSRAAQLHHADEEIVSDPEILGGVPCFKGTRVPIASVLAAQKEAPFDTLKEAYPFLTTELLELASVYVRARPRVGRPRRVEEAIPDAKLIRTKVVRPAKVRQ